MLYITKEFYNDKKNQKNAFQLSRQISDCLHQNGDTDNRNIPIAAYFLYKISQKNNPFEIAGKSIIDDTLDIKDNIRYLIKERLSDATLEDLIPLVSKYSPETFALTVLLPIISNKPKESMQTPDSIVKLVHKLLNVKKDEHVADICCGSGAYLLSAALEEKNAFYHGYDINTENGSVAQIRSELIDADIQINFCDVFHLAKNTDELKFDKIFSNYPFGVKIKNVKGGAEYLETVCKNYPELSKNSSSDWIFNLLLCDLLKETGKGIGIMTNGSTWNSIDTPMRKYFAEKKMIECVIALPARMFDYTNIPTTLIIFSHNNDSVRMIDASDICQQGRRQNEFSDDDITAIIEALSTDSEYSKKISIEKLRDNEYNLSLSHYITKDKISFKNGVPFENIIKSITRGAPCTAKQLDEMISDNVTNMQYLMLANIQDGMIDNKLPYLSHIDPKFEKYCLKNNSLILSKNGYPYKIAVASVKAGQRILANGNLYIIELDETKADPYYVKAFFDSEQGDSVLKSITAGAAIPNIGIDKLRKIEIPLLPLDQQKLIARKYQATQDEVCVLKLRLEKAINRLHDIYEEECE